MIHAAGSAMLPVQAAQPMSGGKAPTTDPTQVFQIVMRFSGVYADV